MLRRLLATLVLAVALVGCSQQTPDITLNDQVPADQRTEETPADGQATENGGDGGGESLQFVAVDIDYSDAPDQAPAGSLAFELVNEGTIPHNVVIEELGDLVVVEAAGGATEVGSVTLEPGTYTYYCSIPGHRAAGMEGTLEAA